jgi:large exoprotein involved in heme utilization and adhesion
MSLKNGAIIGADTTGGGNAGQVAVIAESLRLGGDGTAISTRSRGTGAGGEVLVAAADLTMMDLARIGADTGGRGDAGAVAVVVDNATLTGGARISSDSGISFGSGFLVGSGAGGTVDLLAAETLSLSGAGTRVSTNTRGAGRGGNVTLQARQLVLRDGASISADSFGTGLAGDVTITLGDRLDIDNASIATRAVVSDGGNIRITAPNFVGLRDSQITTSVQSGVGGGGNVFIDPEFVVLQNSQIIANAFGGPGGNIRIVAGQLIADPYSVISASSALGIDGTVNIDAPDTDVSAGLAVLPESFLDAASLMQAGCGAARAGLSSLVEVGRGGLPPDPDDYLPSLDPGAAAGRGDAAGAGQASLPARFAAGLLAFAPASECLR